MQPYNREPNKKFIAQDGLPISDSILSGYVPERVLSDRSCRMRTEPNKYVTRASLQRALNQIDAKTLNDIRDGDSSCIDTWVRLAEKK